MHAHFAHEASRFHPWSCLWRALLRFRYRDPACAAPSTTTLCDEVPFNDYTSSVRLCACSGSVSGRRRALKHVAAHAEAIPPDPYVEAERAELKRAAERTAAKVAAAGGCPNARRALAEDQRRGGEGAALLQSAAACPAYAAARLAQRGGLVSVLADHAGAEYEVPDPSQIADTSDFRYAGIELEGGFAPVPVEEEEEEGHGGEATAEETAEDENGDANADARLADASPGRRLSWSTTQRQAAPGLLGMVGLAAMSLGALALLTQSARRLARRDGGGRYAYSWLGFLATLSPIEGHNWAVWIRRRGGGGVGVNKPCPSGGKGLPGYRLNRGQQMNFGFVAGHGGPTYAVLVHSEDYDRLNEFLADGKIAGEYLASAPKTSRYMENGIVRPFWQKAHIGVRSNTIYNHRGMTVASVDDPDVPRLSYPGDGDDPNYWTTWLKQAHNKQTYPFGKEQAIFKFQHATSDHAFAGKLNSDQSTCFLP